MPSSRCSSCQHLNPESVKFCGECGAPLTLNKSDATPSSGERRQVTVLFSDLSGYTTINEKLDPEEVREVMGRVFGDVSRIIIGYGGVVEKFIGDAVMAVFGLTRANEDDALRAVRAARDIDVAVSKATASLATRLGRDIGMHSGINTGLVVTGQVADGGGAMGVVGDAVNVAARLSSLAKNGEIMVGGATATLVERFFELKPLPPTEVKGKSESVSVFQVLEPRARPVTTHRFSGLRAPLTGRDQEFIQLREAYQQLRNARGTTIALRAEAGTGKSRLVEEFRASLPTGEHQWFSGIAYDHTRAIPYAPIVDLLSGAWGVREGDRPAELRNKIEAGARSVLGDAPTHIPYLGTLFAIEYPEATEASSEYRKNKIQEALLAVFEGMARTQPTVFHLEDLHWADPSTIELVREGLSNFSVPAVIVATYRPPFHLFADAKTIPNYREIELQPLTPSLTDEMVRALMEGGQAPEELLKFVSERSGGNPFFIEEILNSLRESKTLTRDSDRDWRIHGRLEEAQVPGTLQGVIAARLDRLPTDHKRLLQEAAVIGQSFFYAVLGRITTLGGELRPRLDGLESQDMVRTHVLEPDLEYMFKHPLIQEVVYHSLLIKDRQVIHERVGQAIEEVLSERLPEYYERLAHHFQLGQSRDKAIRYLIQSGTKAMDRFSLDEAQQYYEQAYQLCFGDGDSAAPAAEVYLDLLTSWGELHFYTGAFGELEARWLKHLPLVETVADSPAKAMYFGWVGVAHHFAARLNPSEQYLRRGLAIARTTGDRVAESYLSTWLSMWCSSTGNFREGVELGQHATEIAKEVPNDDFLLVQSMAMISYSHMMSSNARENIECAQRMIDTFERRNIPRGLAYAHMQRSTGLLNAGDFDAAFEETKKCKTKDPYYHILGKWVGGFAVVQAGRAAPQLETCSKELQALGNRLYFQFANIIVVLHWILCGRMAHGMRSLKRIQQVLSSDECNWPFLFHFARMMEGLIYANLVLPNPVSFGAVLRNAPFLFRHLPGAAGKAVAILQECADYQRSIGADGNVAQCLLWEGRVHARKKRRDLARACFEEAEQLFDKVGAYAYLAQTREALARL